MKAALCTIALLGLSLASCGPPPEPTTAAATSALTASNIGGVKAIREAYICAERQWATIDTFSHHAFVNGWKWTVTVTLADYAYPTATIPVNALDCGGPHNLTPNGAPLTSWVNTSAWACTLRGHVPGQPVRTQAVTVPAYGFVFQPGDPSTGIPDAWWASYTGPSIYPDGAGYCGPADLFGWTFP